MDDNVLINDAIRADEVRVVGPAGENLGVMQTRKAIALAKEQGLDLIEVSGRAIPPVCKITDYGKYKYELSKKNKEIKSKQKVSETKELQVKIGTSDNDMKIKSSKADEWLADGHRVKIDLYLWGRYKYMQFDFLKSRLERFLATIETPFRIAEPVQKSLKGLSVTLEFEKSGKRIVFASVPVDEKLLKELETAEVETEDEVKE